MEQSVKSLGEAPVVIAFLQPKKASKKPSICVEVVASARLGVLYWKRIHGLGNQRVPRVLIDLPKNPNF